MESNDVGTKSLTQIDGTSNFVVGTGRTTNTSSSIDSAIISASMSETSDEEFEFPPLPLTLPSSTPVILCGETDTMPPPPLPLALTPINHSETTREWDNESGFQNDEDEFPPPPPECFSTVPQTPPIAKIKDSQESNNVLSKDTSCPPKLYVETIISGKESNKLKLPSSFCYITGDLKTPFLEDKPSQKSEEQTTGEGNFEENVQESNDSSIEENKKPFAKLFKNLNLKATADKAECSPVANITNSGNFTETIKESGILPDCEQSKTSENITSGEESFVDASPPPLFVNDENSKAADSLFQDAFSLAKAQLTETSSLSNIIKEYYKDASKPDQTKNKESETPPNTPITANALLPKHLKGGRKSEVTDISNLRKQSFDAAIGEMKCLMSSCDEKTALASLKSSLGACRGNLSKSTSIDSYSDTGCKSESASNCSAIPQTRNTECARDLEHQKVKLPTAPKTFRLKKAPRVLGFTDDQIKSILELQKSTKLDLNSGFPNSKNEDTSESYSSTSSNDQIRCKMPHQDSSVHKEALEKVVEDEKETSSDPNNSEINQTKADITDKENVDAGMTPDFKFMEIDNLNKGSISELIKCIPMTDTNLRSVIFGPGKGPNVKGFTDEQIKSMSLELGKTNCLTGPENFTKNKVEGSNVIPVDDLITSQGNDNIGIVKFGRRLQDSVKIFELANKVDDTIGLTKVTSIKRSKSAASLQRKPIQIRPAEKISIDAESNFSKRSLQENGLESQCNVKQVVSKDEVKANEEKSDEILAVSEAKAFFENIRPSQGITKSDRILPKKSLTFSVNKTSNSPKLQRLRQKYQNQSNLISEEHQSTPSENKEPRNPLNATNTLEETTTSNDEYIDAASHLPVESLVTKFGTLKKTPSKKGVPEKCVLPESGTKLPGKSLSNVDLEPKKFVANQNQNKQAWKSFLQTYSEK